MLKFTTYALNKNNKTGTTGIDNAGLFEHGKHFWSFVQYFLQIWNRFADNDNRIILLFHQLAIFLF